MQIVFVQKSVDEMNILSKIGRGINEFRNDKRVV